MLNKSIDESINKKRLYFDYVIVLARAALHHSVDCVTVISSFNQRRKQLIKYM